MRRKQKRLLQFAGLIIVAFLFLPNVGLWSLYRDRMFDNSPDTVDAPGGIPLVQVRSRPQLAVGRLPGGAAPRPPRSQTAAAAPSVVRSNVAVAADPGVRLTRRRCVLTNLYIPMLCVCVRARARVSPRECVCVMRYTKWTPTLQNRRERCSVM